jgi:hypothetical protein
MKGERNNLFLLIFVGISIFSLVFMGFVSSFRIVKKEYNLSLREEDHIWGDPKKAKVNFRLYLGNSQKFSRGYESSCSYFC